MRIITLQREAICTGCGAVIPVGARARYYSADKIYCENHDQDQAPAPELFPQSPQSRIPDAALLVFLKRLEVALGELIKSMDRRL